MFLPHLPYNVTSASHSKLLITVSYLSASLVVTDGVQPEKNHPYAESTGIVAPGKVVVVAGIVDALTSTVSPSLQVCLPSSVAPVLNIISCVV